MTVQPYAISRRPLRGLHDPVREYPVAQRAIATSALIEALSSAKLALAMVCEPETVGATTTEEAVDALQRAHDLCRRVIALEAVAQDPDGGIAAGREAALEAVSTCGLFTDPVRHRGVAAHGAYAHALRTRAHCRDAIAALEGGAL